MAIDSYLYLFTQYMVPCTHPQVHTPIGTWIGSAVLVWLRFVTNRQTQDKHTDRCRDDAASVTIGGVLCRA